MSAAFHLPIPARGELLGAERLAQQLVAYDPGSLLRCELAGDTEYRAAVDALGGVSWGYGIGVLEDQSKPRYLAGVERPILEFPTAGGEAPVDIVTPDIVAVTEAAALFHSNAHGLMLVGVEQDKPEFRCALPLPGHVDQFFFHQGHLVVMTKTQNNQSSHLLHFKVDGTTLRFIESVDLGSVEILDSRRFNEKLVFYTSFSPDGALPTTNASGAPGGSGAGASAPPDFEVRPSQRHRALRVFELGERLNEELNDTLLDSAPSEAQLISEKVDSQTPIGSQVSEARSYGYSMWASDHYFVVTEQRTKTLLKGWRTYTYPVCTKSHTTQSSYQHCWTKYETRPNPDYTEPDNSGGDRACQGQTLSDCLVQVARVSNKTIQVPVGRECEERVYTNWICDAQEQRSTTYPEFDYQTSTRLFIYEYTENGFVRVDSSVHEVTNQGLEAVDAGAQVDVITTSTETYDLAVPGQIQTLYFQNGYLYVISQGVLQVYAMGGGSIVRTATLPVVNESLQSSLFSGDKLFLSDFGWSAGGSDHSTLRVINLKNPAFPTQDGATHQLPGGHRSIIAANSGIFTIGSVYNFMGQPANVIKLGLFSDPYADEKAYLILGTDLKGTWLGQEEAQFFNAASQRLLLPYSGQGTSGLPVNRVGMSRVAADSILSEGAVELPELAQRVRPLRKSDESYLAFSTNSVAWLTPEKSEWKAQPILEYFEPFAIYRRTSESEYIELQRLGSRCRLYFATDLNINQRDRQAYSEEFQCSAYARAYDRRLLFPQEIGFEVADDHSLRPLSKEEYADTAAKIDARLYCVLEKKLVDDVRLDPENLPEPDAFTCLTPEEYSALREQLTRNP